MDGCFFFFINNEVIRWMNVLFLGFDWGLLYSDGEIFRRRKKKKRLVTNKELSAIKCFSNPDDVFPLDP